MVVICDVSAWQYWRTPPQLREGWIDPEALRAALPEGSPDRAVLRPLRSNAREAERLVHERLLGDLKGVSLPVHVMVDEASSRHESDLVAAHRIPKGLPAAGLIDIGNGLKVLSPELAILVQRQARGTLDVAKMMFEACGLFSLAPSNPRIDLVVEDLTSRGLLTKDSYRGLGIYGYSNGAGQPLPAVLDKSDENGDLLWLPAFDRAGHITSLWKRSPITSTDELARTIKQLGGIKGLPAARQALALVHDGAASPAEVYANLLLCSGAWHGGESWGSPDLNRQIPYTRTASALAHTGFAVADMLWPQAQADLEIQSETYHADDLGFALLSGRRAALESMGYTVSELSYEQMSDLVLFEAVLPALARQLGQTLQPRTPAFLQRRNLLHRELFYKPYEAE